MVGEVACSQAGRVILRFEISLARLFTGAEHVIEVSFPLPCAGLKPPSFARTGFLESGLGDRRQVLTGMIPVDELRRAGKVGGDDAFNPLGGIGHEDQFGCVSRVQPVAYTRSAKCSA